MSDNKLKVISYALNDLHLKLTTGLKELVAAKVINAQQEIAIKDLINKYNAIPEYTIKQLSDASDGASISYGFYKGENRIGDIINIPQFLKDIIYDAESNTLSFIFQTSDGEAKIINTDITDLVDTFYFKVTYSELVGLRDESKLIPGAKYRITDYTTTTISENTKSAGHDFDIIVTATNNNVLSELAKAIAKDGDTYFINQNLNAWQLWYNLDNDVSKYTWADEDNGKGVIYRMIDEKFNDVAYDFKNIMMKDVNNPEDETYYYTFSKINEDETISENLNARENIINPWQSSGVRKLNNILFLGQTVNSNYIEIQCYNNTFKGNAYNNRFGAQCYNNTFNGIVINNTIQGALHDNNIGQLEGNIIGFQFTGNNFNTVTGNYIISCCDNNTNTGDFKFNTIGVGFTNNTFGSIKQCQIGSMFSYNNIRSLVNSYIGNSFNKNTLGEGCSILYVGNYCHDNTFGNKIYNCTLGNNVKYCSIRKGPSLDAELQDYCEYITFEDGVRLTLYSDLVSDENNIFANVTVKKGINSSKAFAKIDTLDNTYMTNVAQNSSGEIKVYCEADLIA